MSRFPPRLALWLAVGVSTSALVVVAALYLMEPTPIVNKPPAVIKALELPANPGPGDLLMAFGGVEGVRTYAQQGVTCQVVERTAWKAVICYDDATPPKTQGRPELSG